MSPQGVAPVAAVGPYRLGGWLGTGGLGEVYKAFDQRLGRAVAIRHIRPEAAGDPRARERFRRQARTAAQLGHPAIAQIFDVLDAEGDAWIVIELIDGPTLEELSDDGPLDVGLALSYGLQIASALAAAHAKGIAHRDLRAGNVMVLPAGDADLSRVKILDFGLAQAPSGVPVGDLPAGPLPVSSMSPEQARGEEGDGRSDLFAFGVLLHELLTARSPFAAGSSRATLKRLKTHRPPPARQLNPRIPRPLSELLDRLLDKDPERRPRAEAVVETLAHIVRGNPLYRVRALPESWLGGETAVSETASPPADRGPADRGQVDDEPEDDAVVKTLMLSDLIAGARLVEVLGDREAADLFRRHDRLARDLLAEHQGLEIDKTDGFLLLFDRPWDAVSYALAYHRALGELSTEVGVTLAARVGIHLGPVILHRNAALDVSRGAKPLEVEGLAKPTAARLMSLAQGAQTLLTRSAYDVARRAAAGAGMEAAQELRWLSHGHYRFKGIARDVEVFEVGVPGVAPLTAPAGSAKVRRVGAAGGESAARRPTEPVRLRRWPPPELPERPYPVLLPYSHPELLAGREREIARLRRLLTLPVPVLGLSAPSGAGKSSLLLGGLVPALRAERQPLAVVRHPREEGVAERLLGDLIDVESADRDRFEDTGTRTTIGALSWRDLVDRVSEVERLAGRAPILVLDQFEDVLRPEASAARARLGVLLAATAQRRPGIETPPCRWLLAYRREFHGEVLAWLRDVLADAQAAGTGGIDMLPHDLSGGELFHGMPLAPLATPVPGADALADATRVFRSAIEKPLAVTTADGSTRRYPWRFAAGGAERLARAFAEARLARPDAPLTPELQVVLAYLLARAGEQPVIEVPEDPGGLIERALEDHLRRALEAAFPSGAGVARTGRARALLALRELAGATGARKEGLPAAALSQAIGDGGDRVLEALATPLTRLVVPEEHPSGRRYVLSHDRMAEVVVRTVEAEGQGGQLLIDAELLRLRRFVALETALHAAGAPAPRLPRRRFRRIAASAGALLWDDARRAWWAACRRRRRVDRRRTLSWSLAGAAVLALVALGVWRWAGAQAPRRTLIDQVAQGEPEAAFQALDRLRREGVEAGELRLLLRQRQAPSEVLERGLGGLAGAERGAAVLAAVELLLPLVDETPDSRALEDPALIANLVWALDFAPARDPAFAARARQLRDRVLAPLRRVRPPPPLPAAGDPDWIEIPAGSFLMGAGEDEDGQPNERPQHSVTVPAFRLQRHEVTAGEYRRLVADHPGAENLPARYITWYEAATYAAWLGGRLPTEAEWEYAARAGCAHRHCDGEGRATTADAVAWTLRNSRDPETGELAPRPVMSLEPNPWGLYDMQGNLWEWTADWFDAYSAAPRDDPPGPARPAASGWRADRGSSFRNPADRSRVTARTGAAPGNGSGRQGFRVVFTPR